MIHLATVVRTRGRRARVRSPLRLDFDITSMLTTSKKPRHAKSKVQSGGFDHHRQVLRIALDRRRSQRPADILFSRRWSRSLRPLLTVQIPFAARSSAVPSPSPPVTWPPPLTCLIFCLSLDSSPVVLIPRSRLDSRIPLFRVLFIPTEWRREKEGKNR